MLAGSSAGGYGAAWNFDRVQRAFGAIPVHALSDAGPPLDDRYLRACLQRRWRKTFRLDASLPDDCARCRNEDGGGLAHYVDHFAKQHPARRMAFLSSVHDEVLRGYFGFGYAADCNSPRLMPAEDFRKGLVALRDEILAGRPNVRFFLTAGDRHTFLGARLSTIQAEGVTLADWLSAFLDPTRPWEHRGARE